MTALLRTHAFARLHSGLLLLLVAACGSAQAASFDCAKSAGEVERLICGSKELSELDDMLAEVYESETQRDDRAARLRPAQRAWIAVRNKCADSLCVKQRYEERIAELACDKDGHAIGSAIGSNLCSSFRLRLAERHLSSLQELRTRQILQASGNSERTRHLLTEEEKAWRSWRAASCVLQGETEGGSDGWKNAFNGYCMVDETEKRIRLLKKETSAK